MSVTTDILYPALRLAGVVTAAGRTPSLSQRQDAFQSLNRMLDAWAQQRLLIYAVDIARYLMSPPKTSYTIGPGGDFNAPRPVRITQATIILQGPSEVHLPLQLLTHPQWANKRLREVPTTVPTELYNDEAFPLARLYLWGYPIAGNYLELFTWRILSQYASEADTVALVPAYLEAVVYQLAMRLSGQFGTMLRPDVLQLAREAKAVIKASNAQSPQIASADIGMEGDPRSDFNYMTGQ